MAVERQGNEIWPVGFWMVKLRDAEFTIFYLLICFSSLFFQFPQQLTGPTDHSYFDKYPPDEDSPPDELSGWDMDFWDRLLLQFLPRQFELMAKVGGDAATSPLAVRVSWVTQPAVTW